MLVLFETPAGYALFSVTDKGLRSANAAAIGAYFDTPDRAAKRCVEGIGVGRVGGRVGGGDGTWWWVWWVWWGCVCSTLSLSRVPPLSSYYHHQCRSHAHTRTRTHTHAHEGV